MKLYYNGTNKQLPDLNLRKDAIYIGNYQDNYQDGIPLHCNLSYGMTGCAVLLKGKTKLLFFPHGMTQEYFVYPSELFFGSK